MPAPGKAKAYVLPGAFLPEPKRRMPDRSVTSCMPGPWKLHWTVLPCAAVAILGDIPERITRTVTSAGGGGGGGGGGSAPCTVTVRVAGVGSLAPPLSVTVRVTV